MKQSKKASFFFYITFPSSIFFIPSSTILLFYLGSSSTSSFLYTFFHPEIHRPHIDPTSTLDSTFFQHNFVNSETIYHHHNISLLSSPPSPPSHFYCFPPPPPHFYCFPSPPPPPHFYCFHSSYCFPSRQAKKANLRPKSGLKGQTQAKKVNSNNLSSRKTIGGVKRIEMWWWWWRENNGNVVVAEYSSLFKKLC